MIRCKETLVSLARPMLVAGLGPNVTAIQGRAVDHGQDSTAYEVFHYAVGLTELKAVPMAQTAPVVWIKEQYVLSRQFLDA